MTDKQLKQLLTPAVPYQDEAFVKQVMNQLPKTDLSWRPVWTIRLVAAAIGLVVLIFNSELASLLSDILLLAHGSWTMLLMAGLTVAGATLWICRQQEII